MIDLVLVSAGDRLAPVASVLGRFRSATLRARKKLVEEAEAAGGAVILQFESRVAAEKAVEALTEAGAQVHLVPQPPPDEPPTALALRNPEPVPEPEVVEAEVVDDTPSGKLARELELVGENVRAALELVENEDDADLLEEALGKARGLHADVRQVVEDRVRSIRREGAPDDAPHVEQIATGTRTLECVLSEAERNAAAARVVELTQQLDDLDIDAKAAARSFKARAELLEGERRIEMAKHRTGKEQRSVEWVRVFDLGADRVRTVRIDTNEVIEDRAPTKEERQLPLFGGATA